MIVVLNGEPGWICLMCCNLDSTPPFHFSYTVPSPPAHPQHEFQLKTWLSPLQRLGSPLVNLQR